MALGMEVGLDPCHIVLDGDPASAPQKGGTAPPIFGRFMLWPDGWIKTPLGMEVGLGTGNFALDGDPAPHKRGTARQFLAHVYSGQTVWR